MSDGIPTPIPALGFSYQFQISERRSIVFQTHIERETDLSDINDILDKMQLAANRQQALLEIVDTERQLAAKRYLLRQQKEDYLRAEAEAQERLRQDTKRNPKMSVNDRSHLDNLANAARATQNQIDLSEEILRGLLVIAGKEAVPANGSAEA